MGMKVLARYAVIVFIMTVVPSQVFAFLVCKTTPGNLDIKWDTSNVTYYINLSGGPIGNSNALQAAMQTWTDVTNSPFSFVYGGLTSSTSYGVNDGLNIVIYSAKGLNGILAENATWYNPTTGYIFDSDILFNTDYPWSTSGSMTAFDVQNIATHELGHSLCLEDLYGIADSEKTMYANASPGETKKRTLDPDDIAGITSLYPGEVLSNPNISITPSSYDFGTINMGSTSGAQTFIVSNTGSATLVVTAMGMIGGDTGMFTASTGGTNPCPSLTPTIASGSQCTIIVTFSPRLAGPRSTYLRIISNDPDMPNQDVLLSGTANKWKCRICGLEDAP